MNAFSPLILIPSYNTGADLLIRTVASAVDSGFDIWVIIDGSNDGSAEALSQSKCVIEHQVRMIVKPTNGGKGNALKMGAEAALEAGYTHVLTMDADGQHPASAIAQLVGIAKESPRFIVMGQPIFGDDAPLARVQGRKLTSFFTNVETLWCGLGDTLFGMRVYPLVPFIAAFEQTSFARGFDFDPEIAVRMVWAGCQPVQLPIVVSYLSKEEGGVSHFHYLRDNFKLTLLHFRLVPEFIVLRLFPLLRYIKKWEKYP
ncbi:MULTISPECIES: glycosyltransferase family 2 protein [unclassified Lentimonas]|uniref:glycosyltransferase family 2 protein n=1 Tax=unclassified Lentimonas TaxID=2630993 RepID=UPI00132A66E6|nr:MULTISPECIES: glycosyltransferase family 2 protein [unclassified Lentimonas]CAA6694612.1 FIG143263: Glycosyl transferase [Lentimonas sp. CC19]CAA6696541.1 FIG143263: Glycosyl transferase [Lentimonas sp. CC10]CAA7071368.1 FIG143263: Glycosyl transferase [Lentimonas sp. CC11]